MSEHWKELLPIDEYIVRTNGLLHDFDRQVLTMLYQPLIGATCFSLYMTLWGETEARSPLVNKHYHLMCITQLNLKQILEERKKLEGIGLLKTYVKHDDFHRTFIYELQPPLSPQDFFNDGVLNIYLYNRLGKSGFNKVKQFFSYEKINKDDYEEVTSAFSAVFSSLHPSELQVYNNEMNIALNSCENSEFVHRQNPPGIFIIEELFDFPLFFAGISDSLIPKDAFTDQVREVIAKLAFLYKIDPIEMKKVVIQALDEHDQIDIEQLRKAARDYYQFMNGDTLPSLVTRTQPLPLRSNQTQTADPSNKEEQLIQYLESISPYQFLVDLSGGVEPSVADLQIVEHVMINQKLPPGVVNVLIHYVMLRTDMKLSKNYVEKIAAHWARKEIKTVKQAMNLAKEEHRQYQEWASDKQKKEKKSSQTNQRFGKEQLTLDMKRRLLMLGADEQEEKTVSKNVELTEEERKKRREKMFNLLEGKRE
ncbi:replication initiation and membrane attachment family protein [Calidifontibacillus erzurumensis]|uniref:DnaD domain protein n=1 Tax=Calidifontibacillus erzurumensis TaxID=2741433 RepID=A0A8J8GCQ4_9BACI|nr:DnaD domain protein [Calidifontibacillus erzurumensis]NSL51525.1 DnaD domain protein [Calidifontibacillus erzurumensis]